MQRFFLLVAACALTIFPPAPSNAQESAHAPVRIAFMGDFLPAGSAQPVIDRYGYARLFDGVREILSTTDAVVLNLETPLTTRGRAVEGKTYTFRASPETAAAMKAEGVRAVWLANNHILDFGPEALADTIAYVEDAGISHPGAGMDVGSAYSPAIVELKGQMTALLGYSNTFPERYWARKGRPGTAFGSPKAVARGVAAADQAAGGPVIASFHWGAELMTEPRDYQVELARLAADSGASLVVGHHPHVAQPIDVYHGVPVLYSLGNFSFGSFSRRSRVGILAVAQFTEGGRCELVEVYPLLVDNYEVNFTPRPITGLEGQRIFDPLVKGIGREVASAEWDGQKGVIIPMQPTRGHRDAETESGRRYLSIQVFKYPGKVFNQSHSGRGEASIRNPDGMNPGSGPGVTGTLDSGSSDQGIRGQASPRPARNDGHQGPRGHAAPVMPDRRNSAPRRTPFLANGMDTG